MISTARRLLPALLVALRLTLGVTLIWAGLAKIPEPGLFAQTVRAYNVLPVALVNPFAVVVPWIEVVSGLCLILGFWTQSSALTSLLLFLSFGVALGINIARGADLSCGCFALDGTGGTLHSALVRGLFLMAGAFTLVLVGRIQFSLDGLLTWRHVHRS